MTTQTSKMSAIQALSEDQDMMDFQDLCASPAKSEASSVDIYDGLDMSMIVSEETTKQSSPSKDCLDLYEEILTEEGTAKEASLNNLNVEYEKSQKQIKQLISKLKEMHCKNTSLLNENQCLKKNISALIKTARVEITRKDEEINKLNQRLYASGNTRGLRSDPVPLLSFNVKLKDRDLSKDAIKKPSSTRKEVKPQATSCKDLPSNYLSPKSFSEQTKSSVENNSELNSKTQERCFKESEETEKSTSRHKEMVDKKKAKTEMDTCSQTKDVDKQTKSSVENNSELNSKTQVRFFKESEETEKLTSRHKEMVDKKKTKTEKDTCSQTKDVDRWQRSDGHRSSLSTQIDTICEVKEKSHGQPTKAGKGERYQESRNFKKTDVDYKSDSRKHSSSSHDKPSFLKDTRVHELHHSKEKHIKTHEKSEHRKESKGHERDKNMDHRHRTLEKDDGSQRLKKKQSSSLKTECSQKSVPSELNPTKRSNEPDRRDKRCSDYGPSKNGSKDSKSKKTEVGPSSAKQKNNCDGRSSAEWESRTEKKRSKDEEHGTKSDQNHRGHKKEEKMAHQSPSKEKLRDGLGKAEVKPQNITKALTDQKDDNAVKDLKLSFMETLNLTLSPAKKKSQDSDPVSSLVPAKETDTNSVTTEESFKVCLTTEDGVDFHECSSKPNPIDSTKMDVEDAGSSYSKSEHQLEPIEHIPEHHKEQSTVTVKEVKAVAEPFQSDVDCVQVVNTQPEGNTSDDFDSHSILNESDLIVLDSYIEADKCSDNEMPSKDLNMSVPVEKVQNDGEILVQISKDVDQTSNLKPNITGPTAGICESSNTNQCLHDESSVMSLDLNFLRRIPKVVSPLKSPAKPLAHLSTSERTAKASVVSISYKDPSGANISNPNELNKENCEPVSKTDLDSETVPIEISSDEVEEGEIVSDEELVNEQSSQSKSSPSQAEPIKDTNVIKSPVSQESKIVSLSKPNGVISPLRQSTSETKKKTKDIRKTKLLALPIDKRKNADSCLEGVLNIVPPSNIQDVLQMLRIIRKHIRKKYMKFKIQFPLTQFHRFVEATSLYFTTLANRLDWSSLSSSPGKLQNKLCKLIESRLKQLKKNGIVDRIFEQRLIDMKKRLWKFVEEQLDSLFDTLKGMIIKLCDKAKLECEQDEKKHNSAKMQRSDRIKKSQNANKTAMAKMSLSKSENERCLRRLDVHYKREVADTNPQTVEDPSVEKKVSKNVSTSGDKNGLSASNNVSPKSNIPPFSATKSDQFSECQKDQHNSSGLSFNLVSDDHMGDIFKSLLNDSDNLELNLPHENVWILDTPEKKNISDQKYAVNSLTEIKTPVKAIFPWPSISPPHVGSLPRLEAVLTPDVFDESCLLEVPTSTLSNKSIAASEDRLKSYSVLMEDLAVSLTVPSPLKSDSHLSFLRPICDPDSVAQVNVQYTEDAVLDEEDATEQDIHLTLDSDNSSTGSLENSTEPDGFQCHPSEPMQAVIMEKSNDHFIVKIRRAVSSSSPVSDNSSIGEVDSAVSGQLESTRCNASDESLTKLTADHKNTSLSDSTLPNPEAKIDENSEKTTNVKSHICLSPKNVHVVRSILANDLNQSITDPNEVQLTNVTDTEKVQLDCANLVTDCSEKNPEDSKEMNITSSETQLIDCDKMAASFTEEVVKAQTPFTDSTMGNSPPKIDSIGLNQKKKKRKSSELEPVSKRRNISFQPDIKDKNEGSRCRKTENEDKLQRKHRRAVSEGNVKLTSFKDSPTGGLSAKNVIKKKGEVVVSWTRNEDREILLECQQNGAHRKTFLTLASKMNKYPHQVEERFRQLMKLFKKSRNSIS